LVADLQKIIQEKSVRLVVVGLPLNMNGTEGPMSVVVRNLARKIEEECGVPVNLTDERLTSWEAENILIDDLDLSRKKMKAVKDSMAACLILKSYLASNP
jgi:putative Holliday junction resolvase